MNPTLAEMKEWLSAKLNREVTVSVVKVAGKKCFLADYINPVAPAVTKLVSDSEDGAITALFLYLSEQPAADADTAANGIA